MITVTTWPGRRSSLVLALSTALTVAVGLASSAPSASAQAVNAQPQQSENWAGYVAQSHTGQNFTSVSGSWTQPSVSGRSDDGYSAFWVGLGGSQQQSQALEQVGTAADLVNGQAEYYAWYELVPDPETKLDLPINAGDHIAAKVTVNGRQVTVSLDDQTTGNSATKTLQKSDPDTSSAEWIAEAPATTQGAGYQVLPLADFGKVTFSGASATAGGHTGSVSDSSWSAQPVELSSASGTRFPGGGMITPAGVALDDSASPASGGATPSGLAGDGSSFDVSYASSTDGSASQSADGSGNPSDGYAPAGSDGYSYGDGAGYGYQGGYGGGGGYAYVLPEGNVIGL
jgi:Peptidase A4 family